MRTGVLRTDRALRAAGRDGRPVLVGPFLGEIGYELLYWIPFARRALRRAEIDPAQTTVLTRGGAGLWYGDLAESELDVLDLVPVEDFQRQLMDRRARAGDSKQLVAHAFDRELIARARERVGDAVVFHPGRMFAELRGIWFTGTPLAEGMRRLEHRRLEPPAGPAPPLPEDYIALKPYFNDCLPNDDASRTFLRRLVERLAQDLDVVLLSTGLCVDDHVEWDAPAERVHRIDHLLEPRDNLAVQTRVVARARGFVATYGGFSYLGPLLGVPTLTFYEREATVPLHLDALRAAFPGVSYDRANVSELSAADEFVRRLAR